MIDISNHVLVKRSVVLGDLIVKCFHPLDLPCRLLHQSQVLSTTLSNTLTFSLFGVTKPAKDTVLGVDRLEVVADGGHHGLDGVVVAHGTERDDLLTTLTVLLIGYACVWVDRRRTSDVSAGKGHDTVVVARKTEVEWQSLHSTHTFWEQ